MVEVAAVTLAELVKHLGNPPEWVLVSDIEGAEYGIVEQESAALRNAKMVIMEVHPHQYAARGSGEKEFLAMAMDAGFQLVDRQGDVVVLTPAPGAGHAV